MSNRRAPPGLDPTDRALWEEITKSIKPLRTRRTQVTPAEPASGVGREETPRPKLPLLRSTAPTSAPPLTKLHRRDRTRVARGHIEIDGRLDLHGMTLERARHRLETFLASAQNRGASLVLVITGKGGTAGERGALRREVPHWLSLSQFRTLVIGFEEAAPRHGGGGALYVRVRRTRR